MSELSPVTSKEIGFEEEIRHIAHLVEEQEKSVQTLEVGYRFREGIVALAKRRMIGNFDRRDIPSAAVLFFDQHVSQVPLRLVGSVANSHHICVFYRRLYERLGI